MTTSAQPLIRLEGLTKVFYTDEVETPAILPVSRLDVPAPYWLARPTHIYGFSPPEVPARRAFRRGLPARPAPLFFPPGSIRMAGP